MDDLATLDREAEQIVKEIAIPPCPAILTSLLREMREDETDFKRIGRLIGSDVSLAAAMLKTVNSDCFGPKTKAISVHQALATLGTRTVGNLVTGLLLRRALPVSAGSAMKQFWETSSQIAHISAEIAPELIGIGRDEGYTFGLFRDCGIPLIVSKFSNYTRVLGSVVPVLGRPSTAMEDEHYSINHARIGYQLAKSWGLEDEMCNAILWHHDYEMVRHEDESISSKSRRLIALALVAEQIYWRSQNNRDYLEWIAAGEGALRKMAIGSLSRTFRPSNPGASTRVEFERSAR